MKKIIFIVTCYIVPFTLLGQWQERALVSASGHQGEVAGFQVEHSLGELSVGMWQIGEYTVLVGFHQPQLSSSTSTDKLLVRMPINVYPNPARNYIYIDFQDASTWDIESVVITDMRGVTVMDFKTIDINNQPFYVSLKDLMAGMYFVRVLSVNGQWQVKKISLVN